jgi:hypothetical protein
MTNRDMALIEFKAAIDLLFQAVHEDDAQGQLIAYTTAIECLQDAKLATVEYHGGISN